MTSAATPDQRVNADTRFHVLIVGGGIGGLTAALALRQQGHKVDIFEASKFSQETGAAVHLAPNCNVLLRRLGLFVERIGANDCLGFASHSAQGDLLNKVDTSVFMTNVKAPWHLIHRAHLHTALREMAVSSSGEGEPARLHLSSRVKSVDPSSASIILEDGSTVEGDLVLGADGVHSVTRKSIPAGDLTPFDSGKSMFRCLIPTEALAADPVTAPHVAEDGFMNMWIGDSRRLIMYPCVNNTIQNIGAIHPSGESSASGSSDWQQTGSKALMMHLFRDFAPSARAILEKADEKSLKVWNLLDMQTMPSFVHENFAALGDAAHPFLPHQAQGAGQAIEDALSLAAILPLGTPKSAIAERLRLYEQCRLERAHKVQENTRLAGKDVSELEAEGKTLDIWEHFKFYFEYDEFEHSTEALKQHLAPNAATCNNDRNTSQQTSFPETPVNQVETVV